MASTARRSTRWSRHVVTLPERPFDLVGIAEVLERHGVLHVTIGGACGLLHGATEYLTQGVDVLARSDVASA